MEDERSGHGGRRRARPLVTGIVALIGSTVAGLGVWAWTAPAAFADFVDFPAHEHFVHDLGVFQIGLGATLLLALAWRDALTVALTGFLAANTLHVLTHVLDLHLGGGLRDIVALGALSVLAGVGLVVHVRRSAGRGRADTGH